MSTRSNKKNIQSNFLRDPFGRFPHQKVFFFTQIFQAFFCFLFFNPRTCFWSKHFSLTHIFYHSWVVEITNLQPRDKIKNLPKDEAEVKNFILFVGLSPLPVRVTTRIITFLVGDPELNLHFHYYWEGGQPNLFVYHQ